MALKTDLQFFQDRHLAMSQLSHDFQSYFRTPVNAQGFDSPARNANLANLLANFEQFSEEYFYYFLKDPEPTQNIWYLLNTALENIQQQWETISRACYQRQVASFTHLLTQADEQASRYYDCFMGYKADPEAKPVTYFEKIYAINRFIFTPYPLISIPLQVFNQPEHWQSLAHELGHFIYWNSLPLKKSLEVHKRLKTAVYDHLKTHILQTLSELPSDSVHFQQLFNLLPIWTNWLEETFADVVGTLLLGPEYVVTAQKYIEYTTSNGEDRITDDGDHPIPALRPYIALETLKWVQEELKQEGQTTHATLLWNVIHYLERRWLPVQEKTREKSHPTIGLTLKYIQASIPIVVRTLLDGNGKNGLWLAANGETSQSLGALMKRPFLWLENIDEWLTYISNLPVPDTPLQTAFRLPEAENSRFQQFVQGIEEIMATENPISDPPNPPDNLKEAVLRLKLAERDPYGALGCSSQTVQYSYTSNWSGIKYYVLC